MSNCEHSCCKDCATKHFTILIKDKNISEATCPFCQEPTGLAEDDDLAANYFSQLDVLLKPLVEQDVYDLFQRKLRDRTLMKDPNFKWCYKVSGSKISVLTCLLSNFVGKFGAIKSVIIFSTCYCFKIIVI